MMDKISYYLSKKALSYFLRHPIRTFRYLKYNDYLDFVHKVTNRPVDDIKAYMPSSETKRTLRDIFKSSINPQSKEMPVSYEAASSLYLIVRIVKPLYVVETGVSAGRSSGFILQALRENSRGILYSIDLPPEGYESGHAIPLSLKDRWKLHIGKSREVLPSLLKTLGYIDIFLHDSEHTYENMYFEYTLAWQYLRKGGILLSDDTSINSAFNDFAKSVSANPIWLDKGKCFGAIVK